MSMPAEAIPLKPPRKKMTVSQKILWSLVGFLILAKLAALALHMPFQNGSQEAIFSWKSLVFFAVLAILGSGFANIIVFPSLWDPEVKNRNRVWIPLGLGVALGLALLWASSTTGFDRAYAAVLNVPHLHMPFPYSLLFYAYSGVCSAILYCLFPVAFAVWFFGTLLLARRSPEQTFWVTAAAVALWEPLTTVGHDHWALLRAQPLAAGIVAVPVLLYVTDFLGAYLFRRFGFVAALVMRVSMVAVWHIIGNT